LAEPKRSWYHWEDETLVIRVRAQPRASRETFGEVLEDAIKIHTTAPPVDGAANTRLTGFLASQFGTAKRNVELVRGDKGRTKTFRIKSPGKLPALPGLHSAGHG
jgi:uncharacterized protein (TIGR00251 family)